ncbi:intradiol ring-cleavage dioxygenase [Pseudactinotalea sp.]|uniref:intradiol ring-cleavage dioxygenase n=1 Tax=Pseudactinotalea sp. TaxID=1926260 RepID=UPI003B3A1F5F
MTGPEPDQTTRGPSYQGRLLPRPDEEVVDQGLRFDVRTLMTRRGVLGAFGVGAGALALAACGAASSDPVTSGTSADTTADSDLTEIPDETAGPYPGDGSNGPDVLEESGIVRSDIRSSFGDSSGTAEGVPLEFTLTVLDMAGGGGAFAGVAVYAWHCDRDGNYSMYSEGIEDQNYLRGVQVTDDDGKVTFTSIVPACYSGRWPHIHFEVYPDVDSIDDSTNAIATSQLALPQNVCDTVYATIGYEQSVTNLAQVTLSSDNVFGDDGGVHQIAAVTGSVDAGYVATLTVPIDTTTEPTSGSAPEGGGGEGGPGGGGEPPDGGGR